MARGPIQALIIDFPDITQLEGGVADELLNLSESGQIRIIDAVFVFAEGDEIHGVSVSDLDDEDRIRLRTSAAALAGLGLAGADGAILGGVLGLTSDPDSPSVAELVASAIADELPDGSGALVLAVEHVWAAALAAEVRQAGGILIADSLVTPDDLIDLGFALGEG
ncbi:MAG: hypothetical protein ACTHQE_00605 [Thermomicrobiales bacterium]|jgi:hypothetical protein